MDLLKIKVKNFGAIPESEVDLSGIFLSSILGKNGFGKSTLFTYAPLFALFGKTKNNCSVDEMIRTGTQDMMVQIEFEHQGEIYQVTRTRKRNKKSTLELQQKTPAGWKSLSGTTIAETEKKIEALLNLDANTFIASSLILQNDSNNFTKKTSTERKAVLTQVLGLEIYDQLKEKAKEKEKEVKIKIEVSKDKIVDLENRLKELPEIKERFEEVNKLIALNTANIREKETKINDLQEELKTLELKQTEIKQIEQQLDTLAEEIKNNLTELTVLKAKETEYLQIINQEEIILSKQAEYEQLKEQLTILKTKLPRLEELEKERTEASEEIEKLDLEISVLEQRIKTLEKELSNREELEQASKDYQLAREKLEKLDDVFEKFNTLSNQINTIENDLLKASTHLDSLLNQYNQLEGKVRILHDSNCINPEQAKCKFLTDAQEAKTQIPVIQQRIEQGRNHMNTIVKCKEELIAQQKNLNYDPVKHSDLKKEVDLLRQKAEQFRALSGKEELLNNYIEQYGQLTVRFNTVKYTLNSLDKEIIGLKNEVAALNNLQEQLRILETTLPKELDELTNAKAFLQTSKEQIKKLQSEINKKQQLQQSLVEQKEKLVFETADRLTIVSVNLRELRKEYQVLNEQQNNLYSQQGGLITQLDNLNHYAEELGALKSKIEPTALELTRWETLVKAFSKNGIPALIIENAIPELERISNDILEQMTKGAHSLRFETQRDLKSKDGVAETLDIIVHDWAGARPYETFSGGEQLRIDLAIRLALAELLANRAGSKVEFIIADEIFGSQDAEHRELVIEAIKAVSDRFKKVLIITHIEQAQGMFEQQIVIGEGGKVEVRL